MLSLPEGARAARLSLSGCWSTAGAPGWPRSPVTPSPTSACSQAVKSGRAEGLRGTQAGRLTCGAGDASQQSQTLGKRAESGGWERPLNTGKVRGAACRAR